MTARPIETVVSPLLSDAPPAPSRRPVASEELILGIEALRHAVRTQPAGQWYLTTASKVMRGTGDYDRVRAKTAGYNWTFTAEALDCLVAEGLLCRPDGIRYVPTAAARRTWPAVDPDFGARIGGV